MAMHRPIIGVEVHAIEAKTGYGSVTERGTVYLKVLPGMKEIEIFNGETYFKVILSDELSDALHRFTARPEGFGTDEEGNTFVKLSK